ncbi:hypothetical protein NHQ30_009936 [Ciborinia camelliae]|nr:hypothetical protein NHQ30_009936 [Ciborinia camelliae]
MQSTASSLTNTPGGGAGDEGIIWHILYTLHSDKAYRIFKEEEAVIWIENPGRRKDARVAIRYREDDPSTPISSIEPGSSTKLPMSAKALVNIIHFKGPVEADCRILIKQRSTNGSWAKTRLWNSKLKIDPKDREKKAAAAQ